MFQQSRRRAATVAAGVLAVALAATGCGGDDSSKSTNLTDKRAGAMDKYGVGDQFKATEPLSYSMLYSNHPNYPLKNDWLFWSELTKRTNITIQPVAVPSSDYEQKRSVMVGAGDAPFIIPKTYHPAEDAFVSSGAILPVSDYLDLMPNFRDKMAKWNLKPELDNFRQADGKFYLLPGLHEKPWQDYSLAMRTDILDQLNLKVPTTWDELYTVLKAMKAAYPNVYPFSDRWSKPTPGGNLLNILAASYGVTGGWGYQHASWDQSAKKFTYTGAAPQFKAMLQYLNKLVTEGLLDPESFTHDDIARQKLTTGLRDRQQRPVPGQRLPAGPRQERPRREDRQDPAADRSRRGGQPRAPAGERDHDLEEGARQQELRGHDAVHRLAVVLRRRPGVRQVGRRGDHLHQGRRRQTGPGLRRQGHRDQPPGAKAPPEGLRLLQRGVHLRRQARAGPGVLLTRGAGLPEGTQRQEADRRATTGAVHR
jgi:maltose-binding protein MalE